MLLRVGYILSTFKNQVPYVPAPRKIIRTMVESSGILQNQNKEVRVFDLGSGTGKMLFHVARRTPDHVLLYGVEHSSLLHFFAQLRKHFSRYKKRLAFYRADWSDLDIQKADYVFLFLTSSGLRSLLPLFEKKLKKDAVIVSYLFSLPESKMFTKEELPLNKKERIFVYKKVFA
jgi:SAM-dependent methyltransferase